MRTSISGELDMPTCMQIIDGMARPLAAGLLRMSALPTVRQAKRPVSFEIVGRSPIAPAHANGMAFESAT